MGQMKPQYLLANNWALFGVSPSSFSLWRALTSPTAQESCCAAPTHSFPDMRAANRDYELLRRQFGLWAKANPSHCLAKQWAQLGYGDKQKRYQLLLDWKAKISINVLKRPAASDVAGSAASRPLKRPAASDVAKSAASRPKHTDAPPPLALTYQSSGFQGGRQLDVLTFELQVFTVGHPSSVQAVSQPARGTPNWRCLRYLLELAGCTPRSVLFATNTEQCPLRPALLLYGEHEQASVLRQRCNLEPSQVFILGRDTDGETTTCLFPFYLQFLLTSQVFSPRDLLSLPKQHSASWAARPALIGFLSMHPKSRQRAFRMDVVQQLALIAKLHGRAKEIWCMGTVQVPGTRNKSQWRKNREEELRQEGFTFQLDRTARLYEVCKFVVSFENFLGEGYVTEKAVCAALGGAYPIYWGSHGGRFDAEQMVDCSSFADNDPLACARHIWQAVLTMELVSQGPSSLLANDIDAILLSPPLPSIRGALRSWFKQF